MLMLSDNTITPSVITDGEIRLVENQLKKILVSKYFKSAKQMQRFLKYIVENTIAGEEKELKQYTIGIEALLFEDDFDPEENPAVRIMGCRVRKRLDEYYADDRNNDEIIIFIPKGSYIPEFKKNTNVKNSINESLQTSRGPTLALVSFTDKTQRQTANRLILQITDTLATEISRYLYLQLVVRNPFSDKEKLYLPSAEFKSTHRADYILALFLQKFDGDDNKYKLIYRLVLMETDEVLWSESHEITGQFIAKEDFIIREITATVTDHLQGMMHTHWSRRALANKDTIPDYHKVLVYFRNYTDHFDRRSFVEGVNVCLEALKRNSNDVIANVVYASYCRREYEYGYGIIDSPLEKSKEYIDTAIRVSPNSHEAHFVHGLTLFYQKEWERSVEAFELARSICKNNVVSEFAIGYYLCKMNHWDKGLHLVSEAMSLSSNYPSYYHFVPFLDLYRQGKYQQALYEAKKIITPGLVHGSLARCISYAQLGKLEEAEKEFQKILERYPTFMEKGRMHISRVLGTESLTEKIWDGVLKVSNKL